METSREAREARVRRALAKRERAVRKSRRRGEPVLNNQGDYMVVDAAGSFIVAGEHYDLTLEDLERMAADEPLRAEQYAAQQTGEEAHQVDRERAGYAVLAAQGQTAQIAKTTSRTPASIRAFARAFRAPLRRRQA